MDTRKKLTSFGNLQYWEKHHIIPRCIGGSDKKENLVWLTAREHYIAHWLLTKISNNRDFAKGFRLMGITKKVQRKLTSRQFERARIVYSTHSEETKRKISAAHKGRKFSEAHKMNIAKGKREMFISFSEEERYEWYNKMFTPERNKKLSESCKGRKIDPEQVNRVNKDPEKIRKMAEKHRGMKRSEEAKRKMSEAAKARPIHNKGKVYCYNPETLEKLLCIIEEIPSGWVRGFIPKEKNCGTDIVEK